MKRLEGRLPAWQSLAADYAARSATLRSILADCFADPFPRIPNGRAYLAAVAAWNEPPAGTVHTNPLDREIYRMLKQATDCKR
jgi:hypothetical protein